MRDNSSFKKTIILDKENEWMRSLPLHSNGNKYIILYFKDKRYPLHHWILNKKKGFDIDHINGNTLDNRLENLRYVTRSQNNFNSKKRSRSTQKYKGIQLLPHGRYRAKGPDGKHLGCFDTPEQARDRFIEHAKMLYGDEFVNRCGNVGNYEIDDNSIKY